jgi:hypothetical protein
MSTPISADYLRAGNPATSSDELEALAFQQRSASIRLRLAENPSATLNMLMDFAADEDIDVRVAVTGNPSTPDWLKAALANDESATVRYGLAEDCHTPVEILEVLMNDENPYVVQAALATHESVLLELALQESKFMPEPGDSYKLGTVLYMAGLLNESQIKDLLDMSGQLGIPLGQAIARMKVLPKKVIAEALMQQTRLRKKEITEGEMLEVLHEYSMPKITHIKVANTLAQAV